MLPKTCSEMNGLAVNPGVLVKPPTYKGQKRGLWTYLFYLIGAIVFVVAGTIFDKMVLTFYPFILLPLYLTKDPLPLFAVTTKGIFSGRRYTAWHKMESFTFTRINPNHPLFGLSAEVNHRHVLQIQGKHTTIKIIVLTDDMFMRLQDILSNQLYNDKQIDKKTSNHE